MTTTPAWSADTAGEPARRSLPEPRSGDDPAARPDTGPAPAVPHLPRQADAPPDEQAAAPAVLSERERSVLLFAKQHWRYSGAREQAIRDRFGISATSYYQVLNRLLDRPEAQEFDPVTVKRLRRERDARRTRSRRSGPPPNG